MGTSKEQGGRQFSKDEINNNRYREIRVQQCGWSIEYVKCLDDVSKSDISYTASSHERGRYEHNIKILCGSEETNTGLRRERPNWKEVFTKAQPLDQRQRMNDTLHPKV